MAWYNASWAYRVKVTVLASKVDADLTGFPIYVNLANLPAGFFTHVKSDGSDIRVTQADGTTEVPREVVAINAAGSTGELHFKGDVLDATNVDFYIYYGNAGASEPGVTTTYGRNAVWSAYSAVWHLNDINSVVDSTGGGATGTKHGNVANATGQVGGGITFPGANGDYVSVADADTLDLTTAWTITLSAKVANLTQTNAYLLSKESAPGSGDNAYAVLWEYSNNKVQFYSMYTYPSTFGYSGTNSDLGIADTNWHRVAYTYDGAHYKAILDGAQVGSTVNGTTNLTATTGLIYMGANNTAGHGSNAVLDEIRLAKSALATTWLSTEWNNLSAPASFYNVGAEEPKSYLYTVQFDLTSTLTPAVAAVGIHPRTLAGTETLTGAMTKFNIHPVAPAAALTLTPTEDLFKQFYRTESVGLATNPALVKLTEFFRTLAAGSTLTPTLAEVMKYLRTLAASDTLTPELVEKFNYYIVQSTDLVLTPELITVLVPSIESIVVDDAGRDWETPYQQIVVTFNQAMSGTTLGHSFTLNGDSISISLISGSGTDEWTFQTNLLIHAADVLTYNYDSTTGATVSTVSGMELIDYIDEVVDNQLTKRIHFTLRKSDGTLVDTETVNLAVHKKSIASASTWMDKEQKSDSLAIGSDGKIDLEYTGGSDPGDQVFVVVERDDPETEEYVFFPITID